ncbi:MAG: bifunctional adenosylcobinamide kinase/adenosylcobinamide-phosphate guanylyltransferase [Halomonas sp.]|nr:bifunctional adenosylcobinamide kinase/adenosylcobinamide-phosphate guanylyltransferase [Halomonas sp.]MDN6296484.1 bifunctional adenosylcobinamide kinase/adenosylcobinamide-phosphate guanylyltransferase [Halomonas sp.]MDN6313837.1 bifunctional adenosylcobinamide kinase/adenosylcobinamide-phosphate guanylyltransferase [Halomonas sp.]MDN6335291.1 bifunctional adenosylcobinamide kinase/adenosylcobinamide-phosphate guanylyltransferase [Halomonas sp.]
MQLFLGGARAGKRDAVAERWPAARWQALAPGETLAEWAARVQFEGQGVPTVLYGVLPWLEAALERETNHDALRRQWQAELVALDARFAPAPLIIIGHEVGCGIVPMDRLERRLRDMNGWFNQDAAAIARRVWRVRHGLVMVLKG